MSLRILCAALAVVAAAGILVMLGNSALVTGTAMSVLLIGLYPLSRETWMSTFGVRPRQYWTAVVVAAVLFSLMTTLGRRVIDPLFSFVWWS